MNFLNFNAPKNPKFILIQDQFFYLIPHRLKKKNAKIGYKAIKKGLKPSFFLGIKPMHSICV